jgi:DMSO/TMAO reductase YedYZ molybdopterin-dependent catalytic subunit
VAAVVRPGAGPLDGVPAIATAVTGVGALWWLTRSTPAPTEQTTATDELPSRRGVLVATSVLTVAAAAAGGVGRLVAGLRADPADVALPGPADPAAAFPTGLDRKVPGISSFRTPNDTFYRIDTRLTLPTLGVEDYELVVDGDVENELSLGFQDLLDMDLIERDITLTCVSNDIGGPYVGGARWLGVRLTDVLDRAGVGGTADQILSTDVDGMTISTPLAVATDGRDAMLAVGMNGEALPREHGFPVRMVVPGLYGYVSACKWITRMTLTTYDAQEAYWTERDWAIDAPIKIASRIDTPKSFSEIDAGQTFIGGVAWAQDRGIGKVEVQIDGGQWQAAELGPSAGVDYWRQWYLPWKPTTGEYSLSVRAETEQGEQQTPAKAMPFPDGASGYQRIVVRVA